MPPKWILIWFQLIKLLSFHTKYNPATARAVGSNSPPVSHSLYIYLRCWALVWVACWHRSVVWVGICDFYVSTRTPQLRQTLYDVAIQLCIDKYVSILFRIIFVNIFKRKWHRAEPDAIQWRFLYKTTKFNTDQHQNMTLTFVFSF